ncbi:MAG: SIMPL domain-containing protein [Polyangiaceae bacterium]
MESAADVIVIAARHEAVLVSDRAELVVVVQGSSLVTGRAALSKAKEVAKLVEDLHAAGIGGEEIRLEGVQAEGSSGFLSRTSSATYTLRIHCKNLERLPDVLGAVTGSKNGRLQEIVWRYPDTTEHQTKWLQQCIAHTNQRARAAAAALGTRIVGVHRLTEERLDEAAPSRSEYAGVAPLMARARSAPIDLGFELSQQKTAVLRVTVHYRVEGFETAGSA